jgi:hypothetical protein
MHTNPLPTMVLTLALLSSPIAWAQNAGHSPDGQVPGPNATQPQADEHVSDGKTNVQVVPGAMPDSDAAPSTLSAKNAADDKLITAAYTFKALTDEQRAAIYQSLKGKRPDAGVNADIGIELPPSVDLAAVPDDVAAKIPQTKGYQYALANGKVLLVSPNTRIVVGMIGQ